MRVLVWHWGRFGAGPKIAAGFAEAFAGVPGVSAALSLSESAEILRCADPPRCHMAVRTYSSAAGFAARFAAAPLTVPGLARRVAAIAPDLALCAMPAPLDLLMVAALRRAGVPFAAVVHDADLHPGDGYPLQMTLQRRMVRHAEAVVALTDHVAGRLREQGLLAGRKLLMAPLPPVPFGATPPPPLSHGGPMRLLSFGRLLAYKGLDLLAESLAALGPRPDIAVRVVGSGPQSAALEALRALPNVTVENRWVPEDEVGALLAWSDALVLSHREASQSGVAAAAIAARRFVVSTRVGGLAEQLAGCSLARLCEPDAASLAAAIDTLVRDPPVPGVSPPAWTVAAGQLALRLGEALLPPGRLQESVGRRLETVSA